MLAAALGVLGPNLLATYLYGSAVQGGLQRWSDLDLLVVTERAMTRDHQRELISRIVPLSRFGVRPATWRPVELTVVVRDEIVPWRYPPRHDFQYGEWLGEELGDGRITPVPAANPDLAILLTTVRDGGRPLLGPAASELLAPVPADDLRHAMLDGLDGLLADLDGDERNVILTLARIWMTLVTGEIRSKDAAAGWALQRLPLAHRAVLERARAIYLDQAPETWDRLSERIGPCVAHLVGEVRGAAGEH